MMAMGFGEGGLWISGVYSRVAIEYTFNLIFIKLTARMEHG